MGVGSKGSGLGFQRWDLGLWGSDAGSVRVCGFEGRFLVLGFEVLGLRRRKVSPRGEQSWLAENLCKREFTREETSTHGRVSSLTNPLAGTASQLCHRNPHPSNTKPRLYVTPCIC